LLRRDLRDELCVRQGEKSLDVRCTALDGGGRAGQEGRSASGNRDRRRFQTWFLLRRARYAGVRRPPARPRLPRSEASPRGGHRRRRARREGFGGQSAKPRRHGGSPIAAHEPTHRRGANFAASGAHGSMSLSRGTAIRQADRAARPSAGKAHLRSTTKVPMAPPSGRRHDHGPSWGAQLSIRS
jgi:hypothetical protein